MSGVISPPRWPKQTWNSRSALAAEVYLDGLGVITVANKINDGLQFNININVVVVCLFGVIFLNHSEKSDHWIPLLKTHCLTKFAQQNWGFIGLLGLLNWSNHRS